MMLPAGLELVTVPKLLKVPPPLSVNVTLPVEASVSAVPPDTPTVVLAPPLVRVFTVPLVPGLRLNVVGLPPGLWMSKF